jgi:hypothetical protein
VYYFALNWDNRNIVLFLCDIIFLVADTKRQRISKVFNSTVSQLKNNLKKLVDKEKFN